MINVTTGFKKLVLDRKKYDEDLKAVCLKITAEAATEWLRAVINSLYPPAPSGAARGFPAWTGMTKASFKPLARWVKEHGGNNVVINITPNPRSFNKDGSSKSKNASPSLGEDQGAADMDAEPIKMYSNQYGPYRFDFRFHTSIFQYLLNEHFGTKASPRSPWESLERGRLAFVDYIETNLIQRMPILVSPEYVSFEKES